jgi:hypothetical protein
MSHWDVEAYSDTSLAYRRTVEMSTAFPEDQVRSGRMVLRMIAELHLRGYQLLRVVPHLYELGTWRCGVTAKSNTLASNGALASNWSSEVMPQYSSASGRNYFGWADAQHASPSRLADLFIERFPQVVQAGFGKDWVYAGWYVWMLHLTYPRALPIAQAVDLDLPPNQLGAIGPVKRYIELSPPGSL